jgi:hypothetical protein
MRSAGRCDAADSFRVVRIDPSGQASTAAPNVSENSPTKALAPSQLHTATYAFLPSFAPLRIQGSENLASLVHRWAQTY